MDINETLRVLRQELARFNAANDVDHEWRTLADAAVDLDEWLSRGGFLPADWARNR